MRSRKHDDRQCHVFSICHTLFVMSTSRMSWSNSLFPCCKGLSRCGQKCGASSRGPSFISFIVTGCHVLGQTASVLYCGLRHIALYHIRRHKHMFYPSAFHKIFVCWMNVCIFPQEMRADTNRRHYQILAIKDQWCMYGDEDCEVQRLNGYL